MECKKNNFKTSLKNLYKKEFFKTKVNLVAGFVSCIDFSKFKHEKVLRGANFFKRDTTFGGHLIILKNSFSNFTTFFNSLSFSPLFLNSKKIKKSFYFFLLFSSLLFASCDFSYYDSLSEDRKEEIRNETVDAIRSAFASDFLNCHENSIQWALECLEDLDHNGVPDKFYKKENILQSYLHFGQREGLPELWGNLKQFILDNKIINYYGDLETYTDVVDTDGDRIPDVVEKAGALRYITNPNFYDTDWDGLSDLDEILWGTNPVTSDSNWDGIWDGSSVINRISYPYSKEVVTNSGADSDADGIPNGAEQFYLGTDPKVYSSDGDRYGDGQEYFGIDSRGEPLPSYVPADPFTPAAPEIEIYVDKLLDIYIPKKEVSRKIVQKGSVNEFVNTQDFSKKQDFESSVSFETGARLDFELSKTYGASLEAGASAKFKFTAYAEAKAKTGFKFNQVVDYSQTNIQNNKDSFDVITEYLETSENVEFRYLLKIKNVGNDILVGPLQDLLFSVRSLDEEYPFFSSIPTFATEVQYNNIIPGSEILVIIPIKVDYDHFQKFKNGIGLELTIDFLSYGEDQIIMNNIKSRNIELVLIDGMNKKTKEYIPVKKSEELSLRQLLTKKKIPYNITRDQGGNVVINSILDIKNQYDVLPYRTLDIQVSNNLEGFDVGKTKDYEDLDAITSLNYLLQDIKGGCSVEYTDYFNGHILSKKLVSNNTGDVFNGFKFFPPAGDENNLGEISPRYIEFPRFFQYYGASPSKQTSLDKYFITGVYTFENEISPELREGEFKDFLDGRERAEFLILSINPAVDTFEEIFYYMNDMTFFLSNGNLEINFTGKNLVEEHLIGTNRVYTFFIPELDNYLGDTGKKFFETGYNLDNRLDFRILYEEPCDFESKLNFGESNAFLFGAGDKIVITEKVDADGDGLTFEEEISNGTNPNLMDTDGDGLTDGYSISSEIGELTLGSNPKKKDTDGDGYDDFIEYTEGTDLNDNTSFPSILIVPQVHFYSTYVPVSSFKKSFDIENGKMFIGDLSSKVSLFEPKSFSISENYLAEVYQGSDFTGKKRILSGERLYDNQDINFGSLKIYEKDLYLEEKNIEGYYIFDNGIDKITSSTLGKNSNPFYHNVNTIYVSEGCYLQLYEENEETENYYDYSRRTFYLENNEKWGPDSSKLYSNKDRGFKVALTEGFWQVPPEFSAFKSSIFYCGEENILALVSPIEEPHSEWFQQNKYQSSRIEGESMFLTKGVETCELIDVDAERRTFWEGRQTRLDNECYGQFTSKGFPEVNSKKPIKYAKVYSDDVYLYAFGEKFEADEAFIDQGELDNIVKIVDTVHASEYMLSRYSYGTESHTEIKHGAGRETAILSLSDAHIHYKDSTHNGKSLLADPGYFFDISTASFREYNYNPYYWGKTNFKVRILNSVGNIGTYKNLLRDKDYFDYKRVSKIFPKKGEYIFKDNSAFDKVYFFDKEETPLIVSTYDDENAIQDEYDENGLMYALSSLEELFNWEQEDFSDIYDLDHLVYHFPYGQGLGHTTYGRWADEYGIELNAPKVGRIDFQLKNKLKNYYLPSGETAFFYLHNGFEGDGFEIVGDRTESFDSFVTLPYNLRDASSIKVEGSEVSTHPLDLLVISPQEGFVYSFDERELLIDFQGSGSNIEGLFYDYGDGRIEYTSPVFVVFSDIPDNNITFYVTNTDGEEFSKEVSFYGEEEPAPVVQGELELTLSNSQSSPFQNFPVKILIDKRNGMGENFENIRIHNRGCNNREFGNEIPFELDYSTPIKGFFWVKIPSFNPGENDICVVYGNDIHPSYEGEKVWRGDNPLENNDLAVWHFSEQGTNDLRLDSTGNGNDALPNSITKLDSGIGFADSFNGIDGYLELPEMTIDSSDLTFFFVSKWDEFDSWSKLLDIGNGEGINNIIIGNNLPDHNLFINVRQGSVARGFQGVQLNKGEWGCFAITLRGDTTSAVAKIYKDGLLRGSSYGQDFFLPNTNTYTENYIGKNSWANVGHLNGAIDELRIIRGAKSREWITEQCRYFN